MPLSSDDIAAAYARYHGAILSYCRVRLGSLEAAEDAAGAVWEGLVRAAPTYEDRGWPVSAWLYRAANSRCVDVLRQRARRTEIPLLPHLSTQARYADVEARADAAAILERLLERQRVALTLDMHDYTDAEIAAALGSSVAAIKGLMHRARAVVKGTAHGYRVD